MHLTPVHNALYFGSGVATLYACQGGAVAGLRRFALALGLAYLGLGLLGFVAPEATLAFIGYPPMRAGELDPDNAAHLVLGGAFVLASAARVRAVRRAPPVARRV
jgi:hypothetical protein